MKDFGIRVASGAIGLMLLLAVLYFGGIILSIGLLIVSIIALRELFRAVQTLGKKPCAKIGYFYTVLILVSFYFDLNYISLIIASMIIITLSKTVLFKDFDIVDAAITIAGVFYIPFLLYHIILLEGTPFLWTVFLISFGTDTFAYLVGSKIGKKRLCPDISPKKSVEGSIGGILGSVILTVSYGAVSGIDPLYSLGVLAILGSILSQIGDLTASRIKRLAKIKDFGRIMPGHGGMLDRFDSVIFSAPVVYYYMLYFLS